MLISNLKVRAPPPPDYTEKGEEEEVPAWRKKESPPTVANTLTQPQPTEVDTAKGDPRWIDIKAATMEAALPSPRPLSR